MDPNKDMGTDTFDPHLYRSLVGSLIYASNSWSDICFTISCISRYMDNPEDAHWKAAKYILRYLKGMMDYGLHHSHENVVTLHAYANADVDWDRDLDTRRSTSGIIHKIGDSPVHWSSKLQPTVSLSTTKVEYRVLTDTSKDVLYLRRLIAEFGIDVTNPTPILSDNQSCIKLVGNPVLLARTKHIEIQHHFIWEQVKSGAATVSYIPTYLQQANLLTKPLSYSNFSTNRNVIGVKPLPQNNWTCLL